MSLELKVIQDSTGGLRFEDREGGRRRNREKVRLSYLKKGEYFVILSDGTKVWINSDSWNSRIGSARGYP